MNKHRKGRGGHQLLQKHPLTNQLDYIKNSILPILMKDFNSRPFQKPVDYKKLKISDYPKIILHPMDLGTVKSRLMKGYYSSAKECIVDVNSVFHNCFIFNTPDCDYYKMAQNICIIFSSLIKDLPCDEYVLDHSMSTTSQSLPNVAASPASCCSSSTRYLPSSSDIALPPVSSASTVESSDLPASLGSDSTNSVVTSASLPLSLLSTAKRKVSDQSNCLVSVSDSLSAIDVDHSLSDHQMAQPTGKVSQCDTPVSSSELDNTQQRSVAQLMRSSPDCVDHPPMKKRKKEIMTININDIKTSDVDGARKRKEVEHHKDLSSCFHILDVLTSKKHHRCNRYFLEPVDVTQEELSDYYEKIIMPMDFGSIRKKLNSDQYEDQSQFESDVNLIFNNCYEYNGEKHFVSNAARRLKIIFDKLLLEEENLAKAAHFNKSRNVSPHSQAGHQMEMAFETADRATSDSHFSQESLTQSNTTIALQHSVDTSLSAAEYATHNSFTLRDSEQNSCSSVPSEFNNSESVLSLDFCHNILKKLHSTKYRNLAYPFLMPVDVEGLGLDQYYEIVKKPMDLQTVRANLESGRYETYMEFADDVRLVFDNCVTYNGRSHDVSIKGKKLQKQFESMLTKHLKSLKFTSTTVQKETIRKSCFKSAAVLDKAPEIIPEDLQKSSTSNDNFQHLGSYDDKTNQFVESNAVSSAPSTNRIDDIIVPEGSSAANETHRFTHKRCHLKETGHPVSKSPILPPTVNQCREVDIDAESEATRVCDNALSPQSSRLGHSSPLLIHEETSLQNIFISSTQTLKSILEKQPQVNDILERLSADFRQFMYINHFPESSFLCIPDKFMLSDYPTERNESELRHPPAAHPLSNNNCQEDLMKNSNACRTTAKSDASPKRRSSAATAIKRIHGISDEVMIKHSHNDITSSDRNHVERQQASTTIVPVTAESCFEEKLTSLNKRGLSVADLSIAQSERLIAMIISWEPEYTTSLTLSTFRFTLPLLQESTFTRLDSAIDQMLNIKRSDDSNRQITSPLKSEHSKKPKTNDPPRTRSPRKFPSNASEKKSSEMECNGNCLPTSTTSKSSFEQNNDEPPINCQLIKTSAEVSNETSCTIDSLKEKVVLDNTSASPNEVSVTKISTCNSELNLDDVSSQKDCENARKSDYSKFSEVTSSNKPSDTSEDESDSEDSPEKSQKKPMWGISRKMNSLGSKALSNSRNANSQSDLDQERKEKAKEEAKRLIENQTKSACQLIQKEEQSRLAKEQAEKEEKERREEQAIQEEKKKEEMKKHKEHERKEDIRKRKIEEAKHRASHKFEPEPLNLHEILCDFENRMDPELFDQFMI